MGPTLFASFPATRSVLQSQLTQALKCDSKSRLFALYFPWLTSAIEISGRCSAAASCPCLHGPKGLPEGTISHRASLSHCMWTGGNTKPVHSITLFPVAPKLHFRGKKTRKYQSQSRQASLLHQRAELGLAFSLFITYRPG